MMRPKYRRDLFYDFRKYRARNRPWYYQAFFIFMRFWKEHWNNKLRFILLMVLPAMVVLSGWRFARYFKQIETESMLLEPDLIEPYNKLFVNERTEVGDLETKKWFERLPMFDDGVYNINYVDSRKENFTYAEDFNTYIFDKT